MDAIERIERALERALRSTQGPDAPPLLTEALRYAVFPGGARIRPRLCLAVAVACGEDDPAYAEAAATAIEFLHCASLVHDDMPCFDDAPTRRGKASVHCAFGEPIALLAGDALIVLAFQTLTQGLVGVPKRMGPVMATVTRSVGAPYGIVAGQAWESEPGVVLADYQRAKTGVLFAGASAAGAAATGADPALWRELGERLGEAYQVVDDIRDVTADAEELGKPIGRDAALGRPNAAIQLGVDGAVGRLKHLLAEAVDSIPPCPGRESLRRTIIGEAEGFLPRDVLRRAA